MDKKDWEEYDALHKKYEEARSEYERAQMNLRGAFSEMARSYSKDTLNENRIYEEEKAHGRFIEARSELHAFIKTKLKDD